VAHRCATGPAAHHLEGGVNRVPVGGVEVADRDQRPAAAFFTVFF
jgi:hypothetical protein